MKITVPIQRLYVPIVNRREEDGVTIVEGYAYVNGRTKSDKYDLTRAAMEDATQDYAQFGNVREMHTNNACGTLTGEWDENGYRVVCRVVDDGARKKVNEGVYKGFSVGVKPTVVRGDVITACSWYETSLVDRPADQDALFSVTRVESSDETVEAEQEDASTDESGGTADEGGAEQGEAGAVVRGTFAEQIAGVEKRTLAYAAFNLFQDTIWTIQYEGGADCGAKVREACAEFADYLAPIVERGELGDRLGSDLQRAVTLADNPMLSDQARAIALAGVDELLRPLLPVQRAIVAGSEDLQRAELQGALTRLVAENGALTRRIDELAAQPTTARPVLNAQAVERTFQQQPRTRDEIAADDAHAELKRLMAMPPAASQAEMLERATTVGRLKAEIARLG